MSIDFKEAPLFARRGLMLDISRNRVPSMAWLKTLIRALAELRYNELQLYTEHTFAYSKHEAVWRDASPITAAEIRELDSYCIERGIDLVPNQNSFGHMERWLRHDEYRHLAECPNGFEHPISGWREFGSTLYPSAECAEFIDSLYRELLPDFTSGSLHVGGDEPWELGKGRSADRVNAEGKHHVYLDFMKQVFARAEKHGRKAQFWADIILERPDLVPQLPKTITPVIWGYEANSPFSEQCRILADAGFKDNYYVAPGAGNWNSFGGRLDVAQANIELAAGAGHQHHAKGLLLTAWGDNGHHQPGPTLYPSLIMAAQAAWGIPTNPDNLAKEIDRVFYPNEAAGNGAAICDLGGIDALLPQPAPPSSFLHSAFFANATELPRLLKQTTAEKLLEVKDALEEIKLEGLDPEIKLGVDFNLFAIKRCLHSFDARRYVRPSTLQLDELKTRFKQCWLTNSREGGLAESLARIDLANC